MLLLSPATVPQATPSAFNCPTLKYSRHKVSCLCGSVEVCSGDICGRPSDYGFDDDIGVQLRDKSGAILDSKKALLETQEKEAETKDGRKTSHKETERSFCFEGNADGDYLLAFVLYKNGVPQPAVIFPTNYLHKSRKACDSIYMIPAACPK